MNAPLGPNEPPSSSGESAEYSICPICGRLVVALKSDMPYSPEQVDAVISADPDVLASSGYGVWAGD